MVVGFHEVMHWHRLTDAVVQKYPMRRCQSQINRQRTQSLVVATQHGSWPCAEVVLDVEGCPGRIPVADVIDVFEDMEIWSAKL
jgi:succinate dehydrogenase/fumarate reductase-like Fe-S protein